MLKVSDLIIANPQLDSFEELSALVREVARNGERFFRIDVKPQYPDTPTDWEDRLEAAFSGLVR